MNCIAADIVEDIEPSVVISNESLVMSHHIIQFVQQIIERVRVRDQR